MNDFYFFVKITSCGKCPHLDRTYIPVDCDLNETEDIWVSHLDYISDECPFRKIFKKIKRRKQ